MEGKTYTTLPYSPSSYQDREGFEWREVFGTRTGTVTNDDPVGRTGVFVIDPFSDGKTTVVEKENFDVRRLRVNSLNEGV